MTDSVLILGANGKIGSRAAEAFWNAGWTVRRYERGTDMVAAAKGCDVIVNGLNPPAYHNWATLIPQITQQVIAAAKANGATVIVPGNVYNLDGQGGEWSEHTPHAPVTRKGKIREDMERAYQASGVQTIVLRAGDFIDPDGNGDVMQMVHLRNINKGRVVSPGDPDALHSYCYVPDWAQAAQMLAAKRHLLAQFEDVPFAGITMTTRELAHKLGDISERDLTLGGFPWAIMRLLSPFWELARELMEMRYLWNIPHRLNGEKLTELLPDFRPTHLDDVLSHALAAQVHPDQTMRPSSKPVIAQ